MAQQAWNYNGEPFLIWNSRDLPEQYTTIPPEDGMYYPIYFDEDTETWIESEETVPALPDEPVEEQPEKPSIDPSYAMLAQANLTIAKQAKVVKEQEKLIEQQNQQIADSYMVLAKQNKREIDNNEY
ncbi:hypothetical protein [Staphylococcus equorum]|uniref:hypothetical protein n=1 Tax=Staphylococcus equorum TaxID=246432 RepID=UPI000852ADE1|nr:hypothetical protein [Staphylococcus equorum]OEK62778.1 hypothetical protein ASS99_07660 [Staphylococcus equorum]